METKEEIVKLIQSFDGRNNIYSVYSDWVKMCALSLYNKVYKQEKIEKQYIEIANKYTDKELKKFCQAFGMLIELTSKKYDDYLGSMYMMLETSSKRTGQFFTPYHISKLMVNVAVEGKIEKLKNNSLTINEPSCGAGANIIAFMEICEEKGINYTKHKIVAQDLDWNCVYMCYVQLSIYGAAGKVIQGDSLSCSLPDEERILRTPAYYLRGCMV